MANPFIALAWLVVGYMAIGVVFGVVLSRFCHTKLDQEQTRASSDNSESQTGFLVIQKWVTDASATGRDPWLLLIASMAIGWLPALVEARRSRSWR